MQLARYMELRGLDDEAMAAIIRGPDSAVSCDRSTISRLRRGETWVSKKLALRFREVTDGDVTADDLLIQQQAAE